MSAPALQCVCAGDLNPLGCAARGPGWPLKTILKNLFEGIGIDLNFEENEMMNVTRWKFELRINL